MPLFLMHLSPHFLLSPFEAPLKRSVFRLPHTVFPTLVQLVLLGDVAGLSLEADQPITFFAAELAVLVEVTGASTCSRAVHVLDLFDFYCHGEELT